MSSPEQGGMDEIKVDRNNLYQEEVFTDLKVASLRRLTPVKADGSADPSREPMFMAQTQVMARGMPLPLQFAIDAKSLAEAMEKFPKAVQRAIEEMVAEAREMQRQQASRIVVPNVAPGKIQMP